MNNYLFSLNSKSNHIPSEKILVRAKNLSEAWMFLEGFKGMPTRKEVKERYEFTVCEDKDEGVIAIFQTETTLVPQV